MSRRRPALLPAVSMLAALTLVACGPNWQPIAVPSPKPLNPGQVVEFRRNEALIRLHGVQFTRDSVSGIPWLEHLSCDTCRVSYALADISQTRTGNPGAAAWWLLGPIIAVMAMGTAVGIAFATMGGN